MMASCSSIKICSTSRAGVFAAGDCIFQKGLREAMVVEAAEQGKIAARSVDAFLRS